MATIKTIPQLIAGLTWFDYVNKAKTLFTRINDSASRKAAAVAPLGTTVNLTAIPATFADFAAARTAVNTLRTDAEARLDAVEVKVDAIISALKQAGLMAA